MLLKKIDERFIAIIILQVAVWLTALLDVPIARQVIGFVYLAFIPGFAVLGLLKINLDKTEVVIYSIGLSIITLMITGLALNLIGPLIGVSNPLSLVSLLLVNTVISTVCSFFGLKNIPSFNLTFNLKRFVIALALSGIVLLSLIGNFIASSSPSNNIVLFIMLLSIAALFSALALFYGKLTDFYPLILFMSSLAILLHFALYSNLLVGGDIFSEYAIFKNTQSALFWDSTLSTRLSAMLSTTILPTTYSVVLSMDGTWIFKILYPTIFAFVPVSLYLLFKKRVSVELAFFAVFFFISNLIFFTELVELPRQIIGELFYVLLFLLLFSKNIQGPSKSVLLGLFSFGLVVSHYALAYFFLGFIAVVWVISFLRKKETNIKGIYVILFALLVFAWYIYIASGSTFSNLLDAIRTVSNNFLSDFLNPQSRSVQVLEAVGASGISTIWHVIGRYIYILTEGFIAIGLLLVLLKKRFAFLDDNFDLLMMFNFLILVACIIVPNFAGTFNVSRFYQLALFFLAPLCVTGAIGILQFVFKNRIPQKSLCLLLVLVVLVPYFSFQTGMVYEATQDASYSLPLSSYRFDKLTLSNMGVYSYAEFQGASWLSHSGDRQIIYSDMTSFNVLLYASANVDNLVTVSMQAPRPGSLLYLKSINFNPGILYTSFVSTSINITQLNPGIDLTSTVYSNGDSSVLKIR